MKVTDWPVFDGFWDEVSVVELEPAQGPATNCCSGEDVLGANDEPLAGVYVAVTLAPPANSAAVVYVATPLLFSATGGPSGAPYALN